MRAADWGQCVDIRRYGNNGARNNTTYFGQRELLKLESPSLNITAHYLPKSYLDYYWGHNTPLQPASEEAPLYSDLPKLSLSDLSLMMWSDVDNLTYSQSDIVESGKCQPTKVSKSVISKLHHYLLIRADGILRLTNGASPSFSSSS